MSKYANPQITTSIHDIIKLFWHKSCKNYNSESILIEPHLGYFITFYKYSITTLKKHITLTYINTYIHMNIYMYIYTHIYI